MALRDTLNENSQAVIIAAVVVIAVVLGYFVIGGGGGPGGDRPDYVHYLDVVTGEVFEADPQLYPPIESPAGNEAVRIHYYTCGECNEEERFVGYYEKYTDFAKRALTTDPEEGDETMFMPGAVEAGTYHSLDAKEWVLANTDQWQEMFDAHLRAKCGEELPGYCRADE